MKDKIKRSIFFNIPMTICNLRCDYCYLTHRDECFTNRQIAYQYSPEHVAKALSPERLGGKCYLNFCADGETLLVKDLDQYIYVLVEQGHYAEIITNLTVTKVLDKILQWDSSMLKRIEFKCSFHYLELKKNNLLQTFADNVNKIWQAGGSANIEITPDDALIPYIDEVKEFSLKYFGALPHLSIARNDDSKEIGYLTDMTIDKYDKTWSQFDSSFWQFKKTIFMKKRHEFCYAGDWSLYVNLENGKTYQCYCTNTTFNVFESLENEIPFKAIGRCKLAHCYNGHAFLTQGTIPYLTNVKYGDIRNRKKSDGTEWLQPELLSFFNSKLEENNEEYSVFRKIGIYSEASTARIRRVVKRRILGILK